MQKLPYLKSLREAYGLSQRDLAEKSSVAHDTIGQLERGEREARPSTIRKLADALGVPPSTLSAASGRQLRGQFAKAQFWQALKHEAKERNRMAHGETVRSEEADFRRDLATFAGVQEDLTTALEKLNPVVLEKKNLDDEVLAEAALATMRAAVVLMRRTTRRLDERLNGRIRNQDAPIDPSLLYIAELSKHSASSWLGGGAAADAAFHAYDLIGRLLGEINLAVEESESTSER